MAPKKIERNNKEKEATPTSGDIDGMCNLHKRKKPIGNSSLDMENKELFIDLALEQIKIGHRSGKGFKEF